VVAICPLAVPWTTVTQTARLAFPSLSVSKSRQASPGLLPLQLVSSKFQVYRVAPMPQAGPVQNWFKSFWPGSSSGPCWSLVQTWAAAGGAEKRIQSKRPQARAFPMPVAKAAAEARGPATVHESHPFLSRLISALPTSIA